MIEKQCSQVVAVYGIAYQVVFHPLDDVSVDVYGIYVTSHHSQSCKGYFGRGVSYSIHTRIPFCGRYARSGITEE